MKKILVKLFGAEWYCRMFHGPYTDKNDKKMWYCEECNISYRKKYSDNFNGPY